LPTGDPIKKLCHNSETWRWFGTLNPAVDTPAKILSLNGEPRSEYNKHSST